ncbi:MAG: 4Fe-4S binding protein [Methermicoccaceae archaeon]
MRRPRVSEHCLGCGECVSICEYMAIEVCVRARVLAECVGCGKCVSYCPVGALIMEEDVS